MQYEGNCKLQIIDFGINNMDPGQGPMKAESLSDSLPKIENPNDFRSIFIPRELREGHAIKESERQANQIIAEAVKQALTRTNEDIRSLGDIIDEEKQSGYLSRVQKYSELALKNCGIEKQEQRER